MKQKKPHQQAVRRKANERIHTKEKKVRFVRRNRKDSAERKHVRKLHIP